MSLLRTPPAKGSDKTIEKEKETIKPGSKLQDSLSKGVGSLTISQNQTNSIVVSNQPQLVFPNPHSIGVRGAKEYHGLLRQEQCASLSQHRLQCY